MLLQWRNQFRQSLEEGSRKRCSECESKTGSKNRHVVSRIREWTGRARSTDLWCPGSESGQGELGARTCGVQDQRVDRAS